MREFTFGFFIIPSLIISVNSTKLNSTVAEGPDIRVEHLKKYCGVKNWTKKMPDWLMFRTGLDLRWFIGSFRPGSLGNFYKSKTNKKIMSRDLEYRKAKFHFMFA